MGSDVVPLPGRDGAEDPVTEPELVRRLGHPSRRGQHGGRLCRNGGKGGDGRRGIQVDRVMWIVGEGSRRSGMGHLSREEVKNVVQDGSAVCEGAAAADVRSLVPLREPMFTDALLCCSFSPTLSRRGAPRTRAVPAPHTAAEPHWRGATGLLSASLKANPPLQENGDRQKRSRYPPGNSAQATPSGWLSPARPLIAHQTPADPLAGTRRETEALAKSPSSFRGSHPERLAQRRAVSHCSADPSPFRA